MRTANIIDGKKIADECNNNLKKKIMMLKRRHHITPSLAVILVGDDHSSSIYVKRKIEKCNELGINSLPFMLPKHIQDSELKDLIKSLNEHKNVNGILLQLPLPSHINSNHIINLIDPMKDVDGFTNINTGNLSLGVNSIVPCTPLGCLILIKSVTHKLKGKKAVIVGRSNIVGKPLAQLLLKEDMTVTIAHSKTDDLKLETLTADILISAVGKSNIITENMVKNGAIVIDVGITRNIDGKLCGDVDFENVKQRASFITPVPGGVGPMTIAMLMSNTFIACLKQNNLSMDDI